VTGICKKLERPLCTARYLAVRANASTLLGVPPTNPRIHPYAHLGRYGQGLEILELLVVLVAHVRCIHALAFWRIVILVEAAGVCGMSDFWHNGAFRPPLIHRIPIYGLEVDVILDASSTVGKVPQTLSWVDSAETSDKLTSIGSHSMGIPDLSTADPLYTILA